MTRAVEGKKLPVESLEVHTGPIVTSEIHRNGCSVVNQLFLLTNPAKINGILKRVSNLWLDLGQH